MGIGIQMFNSHKGKLVTGNHGELIANRSEDNCLIDSRNKCQK